MLGSHILYLKGMRPTMFQLSGFYYKLYETKPNLAARKPDSRVILSSDAAGVS